MDKINLNKTPHIKYPESIKIRNMTYTVLQHIHNKRKRPHRPKRGTEPR